MLCRVDQCLDRLLCPVHFFLRLLDRSLNSRRKLLKLCDETLAFFCRLSLCLVVLQEQVAHLLELAGNMVDRVLSLSSKSSDLINNMGFCCRFVGDQQQVDVVARLSDHAPSLGIERLDGTLLDAESGSLRLDHVTQNRVGCLDGDEHFRHRCWGLGSI